MVFVHKYVLAHWTIDPLFILLTGIPVALYIVGYLRLERTIARGSKRPGKIRKTRAFLFASGIAVLIIAVMSPIDFWSSEYLWVHMLQHVMLMVYAPPLIVLSAPWLVIYRGMPVSWRRKLGRTFLVSEKTSPLRAIGNFFMRPVVGFILFNFSMYFWHFPALLDLSERNSAVHYFSHFMFVASGMLLWIHLVDSPPIKPRITPEIKRIVPIFFTTVASWILAMILGFVSKPFYSVYQYIPGKTLSAMADQELASSILWVLCMEPFTYAAIANIKKWMSKEDDYDYQLSLLANDDRLSVKPKRRIPGIN